MTAGFRTEWLNFVLRTPSHAAETSVPETTRTHWTVDRPICTRMTSQHSEIHTRDGILEELGLAGIPSQEGLLQEIEREVLYPKAVIPEHWLSHFKL